MIHLFFVTYYGLKEALLSAAQGLQVHGVEITEFPLFRWARDQYDKRPDYLVMMDEAIEKANPNVILFWCLEITTEELRLLRKRHAKRMFMLFNWDDPFSWRVPENDICGKAPCFDLVFTCCFDSIADYVAAGVKEARWQPPAFDPHIHHPSPDPAYTCDISLCATQLYHSEAGVSRYALAKALEADTDINFKLYGPPKFAEEFPRSYSGFVNYVDTAKVFSNSILNLCTHVENKYRRYVNERVMLICGSGGLLLVDNVAEFEQVLAPEEHIFLEPDPDRFISQVKELLGEYHKNPNRLDAMRQAGLKHALQEYTWAHWGKRIFLGIIEFLFSANIYRSQAGESVQSLTDADLFEHWKQTGRQAGYWCIELHPPHNFMWEEYCKLNRVQAADATEAWLHWRKLGRHNGALMPQVKAVQQATLVKPKIPMRRFGHLVGLVSQAGGSEPAIDLAVTELLNISAHYSNASGTEVLADAYRCLDNEIPNQ